MTGRGWCTAAAAGGLLPLWWALAAWARQAGGAHDVDEWSTRTVRGLARALDLPEPGGLAVTVAPAVALAGALAGLLVMPTLTVCAAAGAGAVAGLARATRSRAGSDQLVALVEDLAARVGAGGTIHQAVRARARADPDAPFAAVALLVDGGVGVDEALGRWARRSRHPEAGLLADAVALAGRTGAGQAAALVRVARTLRERAALRDEVRAQAAQAIASAVLLVLAPIGFSAATVLVDPRVRRIVLGTPAGWGCVAGGILLDLAGAAWMRVVIRSVG